jgi:L-aspartate oxidase
VLLDLTHRGESFIRERFPRIYETCLRYGVNIGLEAAPVAPAAHYAMGGVRTDLDGHTSVARLFAAGEAACTGVHGANRLASNSLLEGVVFGIRAGRAMREATAVTHSPVEARALSIPAGSRTPVRRIAWEKCGIVRSAEGLKEGLAQLEAISPQCPEERNVRQVALLIARCALAREESRGAHFRTDFPSKSEAFARHSVIRQGADVTFR